MPFPHLLIPHALVDDADAAPAARAALDALLATGPGAQRLPHLRRLLGQTQRPARRLDPQGVVSAHEQVLATAQGLDADNPPWAAQRAHALGLPDAGTATWAFLTPAHWVLPQGVGQTQVRLSAPDRLPLDDTEARAFLTAMQPYFAEDGLRLHLDRPGQWLVSGDALRGLRSPAPGRVLALGGDVAPWLPSASPSAPLLRRLQNEMQMLLYTHPANDAREARGLLPINSFWLHGCGALATVPQGTQTVTVLDGLHGPALRGHEQGDWRSWAAAWQDLDAQLSTLLSSNLAANPAPFVLTLCGQHTIRTLDGPAPARAGFLAWLRPGRRAHNRALTELLIPA